LAAELEHIRAVAGRITGENVARSRQALKTLAHLFEAGVSQGARQAATVALKDAILNLGDEGSSRTVRKLTFDLLKKFTGGNLVTCFEGDDLEDLDLEHPSLPLAVAFERAKGDDRKLIEAAWRRESQDAESSARIRELITSVGAEERCRSLLESYKEHAIRSLPELRNASLKGLLRRVLGKIFSLEIKGWCSEFEARNAASSETRAQAAR